MTPLRWTSKSLLPRKTSIMNPSRFQISWMRVCSVVIMPSENHARRDYSFLVLRMRICGLGAFARLAAGGLSPTRSWLSGHPLKGVRLHLKAPFSARCIRYSVSSWLYWSLSEGFMDMTKLSLPVPPRTKTGYGKLHRKNSSKHQAVIDAYAIQTGRVLWEWNQLHSELLALFASMFNGPSFLMVSAIWHSAGMDSSQRKLLLEVAAPRFWDQPKHFERIRWLVRMIDNLSSYRNIAAHLPMLVEGEEEYFLMPDQQASKRATAIRGLLMHMKRDQLWDKIASDLLVLNQYARLVGYAIAFPNEPLPSPRKPRLRSIPEVRRLELQVNRLTRKPVWHRLNRAFRQKP